MTQIDVQNNQNLLERVVVGGDLAQLSPADRLDYYARVCQSLGLNPLTRPFEYIVLNGRLTLYARRDATDQLRRMHGVSCEITSRERTDDVYVVAVRVTDRDGRTDEATGAVPIAGLKGESLANALMKAETKAKRRATLSICGLGWIDETEIETIPTAKPARVDPNTGEIIDPPDDAGGNEPGEDDWVRCEQCGSEIHPTAKYTTYQLAAMSRKKFGKILCWPCARAVQPQKEG